MTADAEPSAEESGELLRIGEVADRLGLSLRTIRYYEEMGLVEPVTRSHGGFRLYTEVHVARLDVIRRLKPLGFSVQEMRDILEARDALAAGRVTAAERERLQAYVAAIQARADDLLGKAERGQQLAETLREETRSPSTA